MLRKKKPAFIIAFDATTQAMATDKLCAKNGLPGRLIPVPREITAGCGFAWKAAPEDETIPIRQYLYKRHTDKLDFSISSFY